MATGVVKFFNTSKGFGFITPDDGGKDVFVHASALNLKGLQTLNDGQKISYDLQEQNGKTSAVNLSIDFWVIQASYVIRRSSFLSHSREATCLMIIRNG